MKNEFQIYWIEDEFHNYKLYCGKICIGRCYPIYPEKVKFSGYLILPQVYKDENIEFSSLEAVKEYLEKGFYTWLEKLYWRKNEFRG